MSGPQTFSQEFRRYQIGQSVSSLGSACTAFILPLLAFDQHGSPVDLGVAAVVTYLPYPLFGLHIGVLADRINRRALLLGADLGRAAVLAVVPVLHALGSLTLPALLVVIFAHGALRLLFEATQLAVIPALVQDKKQFTRANGQSQAAYNAAAALGPVLAGGLLTVVAPVSVVWVDVGSFLLSASSILTIRSRLSAPRKPRRSFGIEIREGLGLVFGTAILRNVTIAAVIVNLATGPYWAQSIYLAKSHMHASDTGVGVMFAASGLGVVVAGLLAGRLADRFSMQSLLIAGVATLGAAIAAYAITRSVPLAVVLAGTARAGAVTFGVQTNSVRQRIVPPEALGRVVTVALVFAWTAQPLGAAIGTGLISLTGNAPAVVGGGGLLALAVGARWALVGPWAAKTEEDSRAQIQQRLEVG